MGAAMNAIAVSPPSEARRLLPSVVVAVAAMPWLGIVAVFLWIVPKFEEIFRDFGVQLSWVSASIVTASDWLRGDGFVLPGLIPAAAALALVLAAAGVLLSRPSTRVTGIMLSVLLFLLPLALALVVLVSMFLPTMEMIESLQQGQA